MPSCTAMSAPGPSASAAAASRRQATAAEARALGHPTRLRIVFACRDEALTNKELAERLGVNPGTVHHHVRPLLEQGFLRREAVRRGSRGAREQPYRATGKSWRLALDTEVAGALREVGGQELLGADEQDVVAVTRLGLTLTASERDALLERLHRVLAEAVDGVEPGGPQTAPPATAASQEAAGEASEPVTLLLAVTRHRGGS